jgi:carboxylate-amine ligase
VNEPAFTIGIEEEYHLVDRATRDLKSEPPEDLLAECRSRLEGVSPEFLKSQIEVATPVRDTLADARADLARLRRTVAEVAGRHGLAPIATHCSPATCRRSAVASSSAACMSMSASRMRSCASI